MTKTFYCMTLLHIESKFMRLRDFSSKVILHSFEDVPPAVCTLLTCGCFLLCMLHLCSPSSFPCNYLKPVAPSSVLMCKMSMFSVLCVQCTFHYTAMLKLHFYCRDLHTSRSDKIVMLLPNTEGTLSWQLFYLDLM